MWAVFWFWAFNIVALIMFVCTCIALYACGRAPDTDFEPIERILKAWAVIAFLVLAAHHIGG